MSCSVNFNIPDRQMTDFRPKQQTSLRANQDDRLQTNHHDGLQTNQDNGLQANLNDRLPENHNDRLPKNQNDRSLENLNDRPPENLNDGLPENLNDRFPENQNAGIRTDQDAAKDKHMQEAEALALDILKLSRNLLLIRLRFLEPAFVQLSLLPDPEGSLSTDGFFIYYNFHHVLRRYSQGQEFVTLDYLHMVMHCLFHHPFVGPQTDSLFWDTACDIAVTDAILHLDLSYVRTSKEEKQKEMLEALRKDVPLLTAEHLYHFFKEIDCPPEKLLTLGDLFRSDDHALWYRHSQSPNQGEEPSGIPDSDDGTGDDSQAAGQEDPDAKEEGDKKAAEGQTSREGTADPGENKDTAPADDSDEKLWKDISSKVQTDLETLSLNYGEKAGSLLRNLKEVNREKYNYEEFLKQFSVPGEVLKTSEEEFDYIYYTYGLSLYENTPLVEPLEYSENKRIRDFAIVIDTSASVKGDLVLTFIRKTYHILKSTESFFSMVNIHIIQCDATVQSDTVLKSPEELEDYLTAEPGSESSLQLRGFGGTDFRPAFRYVDDLIAGKAFTDLKGLIYFTDGDGIYPESQPDYPAAFVFIENEFQDKDLPVWAIKLILEPDDLIKDGQLC